MRDPNGNGIALLHCAESHQLRPACPNRTQRQDASTSSAFAIRNPDWTGAAPGGRWLITNAHCIEHWAQVPY